MKDRETDLNIFIIGAGGFIGSSVFTYLSGKDFLVEKHIRSVDGDLTETSIPENADVIVNCAGRLGLPGVTFNQLTQSNVTLPILLADTCRARKIHLIHLSTPGIAGLSADITEDSPADPWGDYEKSKYQGEEALRKHYISQSGQLTILRPDFVYGPGDRHKLPFFKQVGKGWLPLIGLRDVRIRPTFVLDVCSAIENSMPGKCLNTGLFNIGGPEVVSIKEFSALIAQKMGRRLVTIPLPRLLYALALRSGPFKPKSLSRTRLRLFSEDHYVSISKAADAGFTPSIPLSEGIQKTLKWYRSEKLL